MQVVIVILFVSLVVRVKRNLGKVEFRTLYQQGNGQKYKLFSSLRCIAVVPLVKTDMQFFWLFFWTGLCCLAVEQRSRIMVGHKHPIYVNFLVFLSGMCQSAL